MAYTIANVERGLSDIVKSIENDIKPTLLLHQKEGGYFIVPREVCCYIDFLGALYCGWDGKERKKITT